MIYLKRFIIGIALPSVILPFLLLSVYMAHKTEFMSIPFLYFIPMIWGIWNVLDRVFFKKVSSEHALCHSLVVGAILGLIVASVGVHFFHASELLGMSSSLIYLPLLLGPLFYAILWAFIVRPLNDLIP